MATYYRNTALLLIDNVVRRGAEVLVLIFLARRIGPQDFGLFSYLTSLWILVSAICGMGLQNVVTRYFATSSAAEDGAFLANAIALRIAGTFLATGALLLFHLLSPEVFNHAFVVLLTLLGLSVVAQAWDVVEYRFQASSQYLQLVSIRLTCASIAIPAKVALVASGHGLVAYAIANAVELSAVAIAFSWLAGTHGASISLRGLAFRQMAVLLQQSWPFILSGVATAVYMRIDQVLVSRLLGFDSAGHYGAVARIAELWYFIPVGITRIWATSIYATYKENPQRAREQIMLLHRWGIRAAAAVATLICCFSEQLINLIYGPAYIAAAPILNIYIFSGLFVVSGLVMWIWMNCEGLAHYCLYQTLAGAAVGLGANLLLIPWLGLQGAAISTVLSQLAANFLFNPLFPKTRHLFWMQCKAI